MNNAGVPRCVRGPQGSQPFAVIVDCFGWARRLRGVDIDDPWVIDLVGWDPRIVLRAVYSSLVKRVGQPVV